VNEGSAPIGLGVNEYRPMYDQPIEVHWYPLGNDKDEAWLADRCLYAYLAPPDDEIVYIGKAWGATVRGRWRRAAKVHFWDDLERDRGILRHAPLVGFVHVPWRGRLTHQLLRDAESLLIQEVQPWGNIQCRRSRTSRPELTLQCRGDWPLRRKLFRDL
jgi:hypothetical protein